MRSAIPTGLLGLVVLAFWGPARGQTVYGQGGLLLHPSAFLRPAGSVNFGASFFTQRSGASGRSEWNPFSVSYGFSDKLEAGVTAVRHQGRGIETHAHAGPFVRYQAAPDSASRPALGFTVSNLPSDLRQTTAAGVLSHRFGSSPNGSFILHGGLQWVRTGGEQGNRSDVNEFVGMQIPVARNIGLIGEVGTKLRFERTSASGIGLTWAPPGGGSVAIGWVNNGRSRSHEFFIGAGYPIGGAK